MPLKPKFRVWTFDRSVIYGAFVAAFSAAFAAALVVGDRAGIVVSLIAWIAALAIVARLYQSRLEVADRIRWTTRAGIQFLPASGVAHRWNDEVAAILESSTEIEIGHWDRLYPGVRRKLQNMPDGVMVYVRPVSISLSGRLYHGIQNGNQLIVEWLGHQEVSVLSAIVRHELAHLLLDLAGVPQVQHHDIMRTHGP